MGSIGADDGAATMDYMPGRNRNAALQMALTACITCDWNDTNINLADTLRPCRFHNRGGTPLARAGRGSGRIFCAVAGVEPKLKQLSLASPSALKFPSSPLSTSIDRTGANFRRPCRNPCAARLMAKSRAVCRSAWPGEDFRAVLDLFIGHEALFLTPLTRGQTITKTPLHSRRR